MLKPDYVFRDVSFISEDFLCKNSIEGLILDIDNTIALPDKRDIPENIAAWLEQMKEKNISMVILSNNSEKRISDFAKSVGLPYVSKAGKPSVGGFKRAAQMMKKDISHCAVIGDQLFTDILGGNLCKAVTILTLPFAEDQTSFIKLKRILEKPFTDKYKKKAGL